MVYAQSVCSDQTFSSKIFHMHYRTWLYPRWQDILHERGKLTDISLAIMAGSQFCPNFIARVAPLSYILRHSSCSPLTILLKVLSTSQILFFVCHHFHIYKNNLLLIAQDNHILKYLAYPCKKKKNYTWYDGDAGYMILYITYPSSLKLFPVY